MKLDQLIENLKQFKEELNKNINMSYVNAPNELNSNPAGAAMPTSNSNMNVTKEESKPENAHMGHSSFNMDHVKHISTLKDHNEAKQYAHKVVESSTANPKNKAKMKNMINTSKGVPHLAQGMSNHILAHPSENLKVVKTEEICMSENGQWSIKKDDVCGTY